MNNCVLFVVVVVVFYYPLCVMKNHHLHFYFLAKAFIPCVYTKRLFVTFNSGSQCSHKYYMVYGIGCSFTKTHNTIGPSVQKRTKTYKNAHTRAARQVQKNLSIQKPHKNAPNRTIRKCSSSSSSDIISYYEECVQKTNKNLQKLTKTHVRVPSTKKS